MAAFGGTSAFGGTVAFAGTAASGGPEVAAKVDPVNVDQRGEELARNLDAVRMRLAAACAAAGRAADEVTLVAVTKTYPAEDVLRLMALGLSDFGENRDQEASVKAAVVAQVHSPSAGETGPVVSAGETGPVVSAGETGRVVSAVDTGLAAVAGPGPAQGVPVAARWHFVGQLQRNKCRSVVRYADMVHSVDGVRLATALDAAAGRLRSTPLDVLVQVSIDGAIGRGGAVVDAQSDPDIDLDRVLRCVAESDSLVLRGLMAVAPVDWRPTQAFARLADIADRVRSTYPDAVLLSAGMSHDVEEAIDYGATHVRIGNALLGNRPTLM